MTDTTKQAEPVAGGLKDADYHDRKRKTISDSDIEIFWRVYNELTQFKNTIDSTKAAITAIGSAPIYDDLTNAAELHLKGEVSRLRYFLDEAIRARSKS